MTRKADPADRSDDIARLRQHLDMPELNYRDISLMVGCARRCGAGPCWEKAVRSP